MVFGCIPSLRTFGPFGITLEVWATPLPDVPPDVSNPGEGYLPMCSQARYHRPRSEATLRTVNSRIIYYIHTNII